MTTLTSPNGKDSIDAPVDQVEYLISKGWSEKTVNKKNNKSEEK
tara:strand:- start:12 stop:143 length:132 start_codon:yes stop_codon:yes gene_type:complete